MTLQSRFQMSGPGLIGGNLSYLFIHQWILLVPMFFFVLTAISVFFINDSVRDYFGMKDWIRHKQDKKKPFLERRYNKKLSR
jgi:peptide/nickel transport system permease protein